MKRSFRNILLGGGILCLTAAFTEMVIRSFVVTDVGDGTDWVYGILYVGGLMLICIRGAIYLQDRIENKTGKRSTVVVRIILVGFAIVVALLLAFVPPAVRFPSNQPFKTK